MPKVPYLGAFGLKFEETIVTFEISTVEFVKMQKFVQNKKQKKPSNLGDQRCLIRVSFGCKFKILQTYFKSAVSNLSKWKL